MPASSPPESPALAVLERLPVTTLRGVGPRLAQQLSDYGITLVEDLLFHLPLR
ncbi:MAG: hypothetical protein RLP45_11655, partial [Haliea sp.]